VATVPGKAAVARFVLAVAREVAVAAGFGVATVPGKAAVARFVLAAAREVAVAVAVAVAAGFGVAAVLEAHATEIKREA